MAVGLCYRIFGYMEERGWVNKETQIVVDELGLHHLKSLYDHCTHLSYMPETIQSQGHRTGILLSEMLVSSQRHQGKNLPGLPKTIQSEQSKSEVLLDELQIGCSAGQQIREGESPEPLNLQSRRAYRKESSPLEGRVEGAPRAWLEKTEVSTTRERQELSNLQGESHPCPSHNPLPRDREFFTNKSPRPVFQMPYQDRARIRKETQRTPCSLEEGLIESLPTCPLCRNLILPTEGSRILIQASRICEPMAGIGTTLVVGASLGYQTVGVELERHFLEMADANVEKLMAKMPGAPRPVVLGGDARSLIKVLAEAQVAGVLTSPPYAGNIGGDSGIDASLEKKVSGVHAQHKIRQDYDGVVASPPYADQDLTGARQFRSRFEPARPEARANPHEGYDGVVSSPPFSDQAAAGGGCGIAKRGYGPGGTDKVGDRAYMARTQGTSDGQIGNLKDPAGDIDAVLTSPPWERGARGGQQGWSDPDKAAAVAAEKYKDGSRRGHRASAEAIAAQMRRDEKRVYGESEGQIANLPFGMIDAALSSPPYEASSQCQDKNFRRDDRFREGDWHQQKRNNPNFPESPSSDGQIGKERGDTYLSAMLAVYRELHAVLKPGGVCALVTKNPVKNGAIRRLDEDTIRLMEAAGFTLIERKHAMLSEDLGEQMTMDGGIKKIQRVRMSFFKRLHVRKYPELAVLWEDVLFFRSAL